MVVAISSEVLGLLPYLRVRYCAQARCIENHLYVAITGSVGNFTQVPTPEEASRALRPLRIEHSFSTELGIGHALTSAIRWRLVTFDRQETHYLRRVLEDQLVNGRRVVGSPFPIYSSDLDGTGRGAEVVLERHAASGPNGCGPQSTRCPTSCASRSCWPTSRSTTSARWRDCWVCPKAR